MNYFYVQTWVDGKWGDFTAHKGPIHGRAAAEQAEEKVKQFAIVCGRPTDHVKLRQLTVQDVVKLITKEQKDQIVLDYLNSLSDVDKEKTLEAALTVATDKEDPWKIPN
jgi:CO dehydrogenase/acetyl-CoA synthase alpha subunit